MSDEYSNNAMADLMMEDAEAAFLRSTIMNNQATSKLLIEKENKKHPDNSKKLIGKLLEKQGVKGGKLIDKILNETTSSSDSIEEIETYTPTVQVSPEDTDMTVSYRSMIPSINENAVKKVVNTGAKTMVSNLKTIGDVAKLVPGKVAQGIVAGAKVQAAIYNKAAKATEEEFNIDTNIKIQENVNFTKKKVVKENNDTVSITSLSKLLSKVHEKLNENFSEELEEMADIISDAIAEALINDKDKVSYKYERLFEEFKRF